MGTGSVPESRLETASYVNGTVPVPIFGGVLSWDRRERGTGTVPTPFVAESSRTPKRSQSPFRDSRSCAVVVGGDCIADRLGEEPIAATSGSYSLEFPGTLSYFRAIPKHGAARLPLREVLG